MNRFIQFLIKKKKFIAYTLLKIIIMILSLFTNIIIVRKLSINDYGIFSVAFMFMGLITTFGFSWSSSSIIYYGSKEKNMTGTINKTFWARNIIIAISILFTTFVFVVLKKEINDYIGMEVAFLVLVWLYVSVAEDYLSNYFLAVKKQLMSSMLSLVAKVIYLSLIFIYSFDVKTLLLFNIISHSSVLLYVFGMNNKDIGRFEFDKVWFKEVLNFSLWQLFGFSGLYLINFGDTAVIKHYMTTEDVGIYNAAYKLFNAVANFAFVISSYYAGSVTKYFQNNESHNIKRFYYRERLFIFAVSTVAHIIVMVFSKPLIIMLYGERYIESIFIFNVLMVGSIFRYLTVFYMLYYNTNQKYKLQQTINILRALINFGLDILFIKIFGLIGPAIATSIAIFLSFLFSFLYCEKRIKISSTT